MKLRNLLPALALCAPLAAMAVPAYPGLIKQVNPDGKTVEIRLHGDESFSYATSADGRYIMEQNADGFWATAVRGGLQLAATAENVDMLRTEQLSDFSRASLADISKYAELSETDGRSKFPCLGEGQYLIVLLQYSDTKFSMEDPQAYYNDWFNKANFVDEDIRLSARDYYLKVSDNKFKPDFVISPVVTLSGTSAYYCGSNQKYSNFNLAIRQSLQKLAKDGFDFSRFDLDNDGVIDNIYFIYAGYGQADTGDKTTIWPHASSYTGTYGGLQGGRYACSNELRGSHRYLNDNRKTGIGTFCHEFGHVLGLPDMYDPNYDSQCEALTPGNWSIMCNGSYLGDGCLPAGYAAYDRWACRWMELTDLTDGETISLDPIVNASPKAYRLQIPTESNYTEYYILENRSQLDVDINVPGSGLLLWHVDYDYNVWRSNRVNSTASHMRLTVVPPVGCTRDNAQWPGTGAYGSIIANGLPTALEHFNSLIDPGWNPCIYGISYDSDTHKVAATYTTTPQTYNGIVSPQAYKVEEGKTTGMTITWPALEDATGYIITVKRRNSSGSEFYVDGCNEKFITANSIFVNESSAMMNQENKYSIRAMGSVLPSTKLYESGWFKPCDLTSGVGSVVDDNDINITVENGNIIAPQGARVFNMQGIETGTADLSSGIYIVRVGNKAVKVVVR